MTSQLLDDLFERIDTEPGFALNEQVLNVSGMGDLLRSTIGAGALVFPSSFEVGFDQLEDILRMSGETIIFGLDPVPVELQFRDVQGDLEFEVAGTFTEDGGIKLTDIHAKLFGGGFVIPDQLVQPGGTSCPVLS